MRKYNLIFWSVLLFLSSCDYGNIEGYKEDIAPGGPVRNVFISPSALTLYVDSEFPTLAYNWAPAIVDDTTVTWSSDKPEILDIDPKTGKMSWGTIRNSEVIITATSNSSGAKAYCVVSVKNVVGVYRYLDLRNQVGIWILDRNVGAVTPFDAATPYSDKPKGNYYQYGRNAVVSNRVTGGPDGKGGRYSYISADGRERGLTGGYPAYDPAWMAEGPEYVDWTKPENTPCPKGWRLPTVDELRKIANMSNEANFSTAKEKGAARLLLQSLLLTPSGYCTRSNMADDGQGFLWSSSYDPATKKAWCLIVSFSGSTALPPKVEERDVTKNPNAWPGIGMPIRCVKDGNQGVEN